VKSTSDVYWQWVDLAPPNQPEEDASNGTGTSATAGGGGKIAGCHLTGHAVPLLNLELNTVASSCSQLVATNAVKFPLAPQSKSSCFVGVYRKWDGVIGQGGSQSPHGYCTPQTLLTKGLPVPDS